MGLMVLTRSWKFHCQRMLRCQDHELSRNTSISRNRVDKRVFWKFDMSRKEHFFSWKFYLVLGTIRPIFGNNFRLKFPYLAWEITVWFFRILRIFIDFHRFKIQKNPLFPPWIDVSWKYSFATTDQFQEGTISNTGVGNQWLKDSFDLLIISCE